MEKQGAKAEVSIEPRSNSLVAIAHPEQHKAIQAVLEQLKPDDRTLEILQLDIVDPETAELAIMRLFSGEAYATAPSSTWIPPRSKSSCGPPSRSMRRSATCWSKMGETGLLHAGAGGPRFRVFPFEGDLEGAVEEIKRIWPQLRNNPIEIVESLPEVLVRQRHTEQKPEPDKQQAPDARGWANGPAPAHQEPGPETEKAPGAASGQRAVSTRRRSLRLPHPTASRRSRPEPRPRSSADARTAADPTPPPRSRPTPRPSPSPWSLATAR